MDRRSRYFSLRPMTSLTTPRHCSLLCHPHTPATDPQEERDVRKCRELLLSPGHAVCTPSLPPVTSRVQ